MFSLKKILGCVPALLMGMVGLSQAQADSPPPGVINCVEGRVTVDGQAAVTGETAAVGAGQVLATENGQAEILLTPGAFLRVAANSAIKMDAVSPTSVKVELMRGEVLVEVMQVEIGHRLDILENGADSRIETGGIYVFNAAQPAVEVYRGKARVDDDRRAVSLGKGQELALTGDGPLKPRKFDVTREDSLYAWSRKRADYDAAATEWTAESLIALDNPTNYATGWYWNPWFKSWAFVPAKPYEISPFGYGYYAPNTPHYMAPVFGDFRSAPGN